MSSEPVDNCSSCKYHGMANINGDRDVCLSTGDILFLEELQQCPLDSQEVEKTLTNEEIAKYASLIEESVEVLKKISSSFVSIESSFDRNDLEAFLHGKTKLAKRTIRAVLDAIERARSADEKHALRKFIATMGNVRSRDVVIVIDEIERLRRKYGREEQ